MVALERNFAEVRVDMQIAQSFIQDMFLVFD